MRAAGRYWAWGRLCVGLVAFMGAGGPVIAQSEAPLRVGVYENPPMIFRDAQGQPAGLVVDAFAIALGDEAPPVTWVDGNAADLVEWAAEGRIDGVLGLAFSPARNRRLAMTREPVFASYGTLVRRLDTTVGHIFDLEGLRLIGVRNDIHYTSLQAILAGYQLAVSYDVAENYAEALRRMRQDEADVTVIPLAHTTFVDLPAYEAAPTLILFNPVDLFFAFRPDFPQDEIRAMDRRLRAVKADESGQWDALLAQWLTPPRRERLPAWFFWLAGGVSVVLVLVGFHAWRVSRVVEVRTRALQTAERAARDALDVKDRFLLLMNHEIRTPAFAITGNAELLGLDLRESDKETRSALSDIYAAGQQMLRMLTNLLEMAANADGRWPIQPEQVDLKALARRLLRQLLREPRANSAVPVDFAFAAELDEPVAVDIAAVEHILTNFLHNALKYTREGSIQVTIRPVPDDDEMLEIRVRDTGPGMDPAAIKALGQPFIRGEGTREHQIAGAGVGLHIARLAAEAHGGRLEIRSRPGEGTTARATLRMGLPEA